MSINGQYINGNNMPVSEALKQLGENFKAQRLNRPGVTQKIISEESGVSETVVKRFESGKPISSENMIKLLMPFGLVKEILESTKPINSLQDRWEAIQKNKKVNRVRASKANR